MATMTQRAARKTDYATDEERWRAVVDRDSGAVGRFYYAVRTTGVYCRPGCGARLARRENVAFYRTQAEAEREGFRPCQRCRPKQQTSDGQHAAVIARACALLDVADEVPDLKQLAAGVGMSASHLHRVFNSQTGLTPKGYALARRATRVRDELSRGGSVTSAIYNAGFASSGRFYAMSGKALGMTPREFRAGGKGMSVRFAVGDCSLGSILVAATDRGICAIALGDEPAELVRELHERFPSAELIGGDREFERVVATVVSFVERPAAGLGLPLDVQGTAFQHRVWRKLGEIGAGRTRSYAQLARELGSPGGARAVARACAANTLAVAIPCHRVVRTNGSLSGYRWGVERKAKLLASERERGQRS
jgi:AraC family transcriptional regulator of adaptative response/methylated-DNA-[protein]-cysteine methyltransferase